MQPNFNIQRWEISFNNSALINLDVVFIKISIKLAQVFSKHTNKSRACWIKPDQQKSCVQLEMVVIQVQQLLARSGNKHKLRQITKVCANKFCNYLFTIVYA